MADELMTLGANAGTDVRNTVYEEHTVSGAIVTFQDGADSIPLKKCEVTLPASLAGYSQVDVVATGKNMLNPATCQRGFIGANGVINAPYATSQELYSDYIKVKPNTTYTFSGTVSNSSEKWRGIAYYDKDKNFIVRQAGTSGTGEHFSIGYTTPNNAEYVRCTWRNYSNIESGGSVCPCQFEEGIETDYEPYSGDTYTASLGQTIYGSTPDVVNGQGTSTHANVKVSDLTWTKQTASGRDFFIAQVSDMKTGTPKDIASVLPYGGEITVAAMADKSLASWTNSLRIYDTDITSVSELLEAYGNDGISYPLATPESFTFTPVSINSKLGFNTMWAEPATNVEVTYYSEREVINDYHVTSTQLTAIADAIREKKNTTAPIIFDDFPDEIRTIETGGGTGEDPLTWLWTCPKNADNYTYTVPEDGQYLVLTFRDGSTVTFPTGVTPLVNAINTRCRIAIADLHAGDEIKMYIYNSGNRGGAIFKCNVTLSSLLYSRGNTNDGDVSFVNQGTSKTALSIIMSAGGTRKYYGWDPTMFAYVTANGLYLNIMYGIDMSMPTIVWSGAYSAQYILEVAED